MWHSDWAAITMAACLHHLKCVITQPPGIHASLSHRRTAKLITCALKVSSLPCSMTAACGCQTSGCFRMCTGRIVQHGVGHIEHSSYKSQELTSHGAALEEHRPSQPAPSLPKTSAAAMTLEVRLVEKLTGYTLVQINTLRFCDLRRCGCIGQCLEETFDNVPNVP